MSDEPEWAYSRLTDELFKWPSLERVPNDAAEPGEVWIDIKHGDGEMIFDINNTRVYKPNDE